IEELANYSVAIRGGKVGLFIREVEKNFHKISFRSHSHIDVNKVAKAFGGGGHSRAAGCRIEGDKKRIIAEIVAEIKKQME
ncbi:MAG: DHHA1 domain-containing protein, partial [Calditrichaceae bacterium]